MSIIWASAGDGSRWADNFTGYGSNKWTGTTPAPFQGVDLYDCQMFQLPFVRGTSKNTSAPQFADGLDTGYFYCQNTVGSALSDVILTHYGGYPGAISAFPWYVEIDPQVIFAEIEPWDGAGLTSAKFVTGFMGTSLPSSGPGTGISSYLHFFTWNTGAGSAYVYHYAPYAWYGNPPTVVADIAMKAGIPASLINQTEFDNAEAAFNYTTGDNPWVGWTSGWTAGWTNGYSVWVSRRVGQTVIETILEVARHCRDWVFTDEAGKLCMSSYTSPTTALTSLTLDDGVISVDWEWSTRWIVNEVYATYGSAVKQWGDVAVSPDGGSSPPGAVEEPMLSSFTMDNRFLTTASNSTSIAQHGSHWLRGTEFVTNAYGQPRTVEAAHYPLQLDGATHAGGGSKLCPVATYWLTSDAQQRRFVTIKQDLRGLDFLLGDQVTGVQVTCDGDTLTDTRCYAREIDFDELTVTSSLVEIP